MKLLLFLFTGLLLFFQSTDIEALRNSYAKASQSNANTQTFINLAEKQASSDAVTTGYKAAAKIMEAKITTEKGKRKSFVKSGATNLENIIKNNPNNAELRLIRLSVQENLPKIVGYRGSLKDDKTFLINNYNKQNAGLKNYIKRFASQSKTFTPADRALLK